MKTNQGGFSLVELMVVGAIMGILACIGLPMYQSHVIRAQEAAVLSESRIDVLDCALDSSLPKCTTTASTTSSASPTDDAGGGKCYVVGDSGTVEVDCGT